LLESSRDSRERGIGLLRTSEAAALRLRFFRSAKLGAVL